MPATITHRFPRYIALPAVSRPGSSAVPRLAWPAWPTRALTFRTTRAPRTGIVAKPETKAQPPATATPGKRWHRNHIVLIPAGE